MEKILKRFIIKYNMEKTEKTEKLKQNNFLQYNIAKKNYFFSIFFIL